MILESSKRTAGIFLIYLYMFSRLRSQPVQSCGFRGDIVIEILPVSAAEQFAYDMTVPEDQNAVRKAGGIGVMCDHKDRGLGVYGSLRSEHSAVPWKKRSRERPWAHRQTGYPAVL